MDNGRDHTAENVSEWSEHMESGNVTMPGSMKLKDEVTSVVHYRNGNAIEKTGTSSKRNWSVFKFIMGALLSLFLAAMGVYWTIAMIKTLISSINHPVESINQYERTEQDTVAVVFFVNKANVTSCGYSVDLDHLGHSMKDERVGVIECEHKFLPGNRSVFIARGPSKIEHREALHVHLYMEKEHADFYSVLYMLLPGYHDVVDKHSDKSIEHNIEEEMHMRPLFELPSNMRTWVKISMSEYNDGTKNTAEFHAEQSIAQMAPSHIKGYVYFGMFEWKSQHIQKIETVHTMTPSAFAAGLCGILLAVHKACQLLTSTFMEAGKIKEERDQNNKRQSVLSVFSNMSRMINK